MTFFTLHSAVKLMTSPVSTLIADITIDKTVAKKSSALNMLENFLVLVCTEYTRRRNQGRQAFRFKGYK